MSSLYTVFFIAVFLGLGYLFMRSYLRYRFGRPLLLILLCGSIVYAGMLLGNTFLSDGKLMPEFMQKWALDDAFEDGHWGSANYIFFAVIIIIGMIVSGLFGLLLKGMGDNLQDWRAQLAVTALMFIVINFLSIPVGMNLRANGVDLFRSTKQSAGTFVKGAAESGVQFIGGNIEQITKSIDERGGKQADTKQIRQQTGNDRFENRPRDEQRRKSRYDVEDDGR